MWLIVFVDHDMLSLWNWCYYIPTFSSRTTSIILFFLSDKLGWLWKYGSEKRAPWVHHIKHFFGKSLLICFATKVTLVLTFNNSLVKYLANLLLLVILALLTDRWHSRLSWIVLNIFVLKYFPKVHDNE